MKKLLFIAVLFSITPFSFSQKQIDSSINLFNSKIDTVKSAINTLKHDISEFKEKEKPWIERNGPWLIALVVGLVTVLANVIINRKQRIAQLKVTLKSKNRQDWINELRYCVTEFATQCKMMNIEFQDKLSNDDKKKLLLEKITSNRTKLMLLLSPKKENHKPLIEAINDLLDTLDKHLYISRHKMQDFDNFDFMKRTNKVVELGTILAYEEWQKIQELEK